MLKTLDIIQNRTISDVETPSSNIAHTARWLPQDGHVGHFKIKDIIFGVDWIASLKLSTEGVSTR